MNNRELAIKIVEDLCSKFCVKLGGAAVMAVQNILENENASQQPLALGDAHVCGWCKGKQELIWSCPICDVG